MKISSADCVNAILQHMQQHASSWSVLTAKNVKRASKTATASGNTERVFMIDRYPVSATVVESSGTIVDVRIAPIMWWQEDSFRHLASAWRDDGDWQDLRETPQFKQLVKSNITAAHYGFYPMWDDNMGWFAIITPLEYFRKTGHWWDQHLADELETVTGVQYEEAMESTFEFPQCNSGEEVISYLGGLGFAVDAEFIKNCQEYLELTA